MEATLTHETDTQEETMSDTVEISGLAPFADAEDAPRLPLTLRCNGREYRALILEAFDEWTLHVRDETDGHFLLDIHGEGFGSQETAVAAAIAAVIRASREAAA